MVDKALYSSNTDKWCTPPEVLNWISKNFGFCYDPCPADFDPDMFNLPGSVPTWYPAHWSTIADGLSYIWYDTNFVNPPYSDTKHWIEKCEQECKHFQHTVILLIPSRTDTEYFQTHCKSATDIYLIEGRLKFGGSKNSAPFPSVIIVYNPFLRGIRKKPELHFLSRKELLEA